MKTNLSDAIVGTEGHDFIEGTHRRDVIQALGGNDSIYAYQKGDLICGDEGKKVRGDESDD